MRDVLPELMTWWEAGETVGVGTVVATFRSAPRPPGASMLVGPDETAVGSVSGGCVEGAVYELAQTSSTSGEPVLERYGVSDDDAFAVGLTCGGILDVFVEQVLARDVPAARRDRRRHRGRASRSRSPRSSSTPTPPGSAGGWSCGPTSTARGEPRVARARDAAVHDDALGLLASGTNATLTYGPDGERRGEGMRVFVWGFAPKPRMLVFGAIDFAAAVAKVGSFLGYQVTVCDARPVFATTSRFPGADEVVVDWPHRYLQAEVDAGRIDPRTVLAVLTHDPKFDVPLLEVALRLADDVRPGYIGAMGSRRTHEERMERLVEAGLSEAELALLSSPDRPRPRRPDARGDGRVDRRRDRRAAVGRVGGAARVDGRPDPPRRLSLHRTRPTGRLARRQTIAYRLLDDFLRCAGPAVALRAIALLVPTLLLLGTCWRRSPPARRSGRRDRSEARSSAPAGRFERGDAQPAQGDAGRGHAPRHRAGLDGGASVVGFQERLFSQARPACGPAEVVDPADAERTDRHGRQPDRLRQGVWKLEKTWSALLTGTTWRRYTGQDRPRPVRRGGGAQAPEERSHHPGGELPPAQPPAQPPHAVGPTAPTAAGSRRCGGWPAGSAPSKENAPEEHQFVAMCDCNVTENRDTTGLLVKGRIIKPLRLETNYSARGRGPGSGIDYVMGERDSDFRIASYRSYTDLVTDHPGVVATFARRR